VRSNRLAGREFDAIRERSDWYLALADRLDADGRLPGLSAASTARAEVLAELVRLKDGPRDAAYERDKPIAWARARAVLAQEENRG